MSLVMDPFSVCFIVSTIIVLGLYLVQVFFIQRRSTSQGEEKVWRRLAQAQKLNYMPESDQDTTVLSGPYKNHLLTLRGSKQGSDTSISLERQEAIDDKINKKVLDELAAIARSYSFSGSLKVEATGTKISYTGLNIVETELKYLQDIFRLLHRLITLCPQVIHLEEEAIPHLREIGQSSETFQPLCIQMIVDICQRTTQRGKDHGVPLVCKRCFAHFNILPITLPDKGQITYYGCRLCGQSREFLPLEAEVIAVLNNQETTEWVQDKGQIKVNWLVHRKLFDFDQVEIQQATDEEVERFAVQVGNDTDESRRSRYQEMACIISPDCQLSESAVRVLDHIFGKVVKRTV